MAHRETEQLEADRSEWDIARGVGQLGARGSSRLAVALVVVAGLAAGALIFALTRGLTFYYDEWAFLLGRRGADADTLLRPHNEHVVLLPLLVFKALFHVFGLAHYWPYRAAIVGLHLLVAGLLFILARRRAGDAWAVVVTVIVLFLGPAWEVLLWPFEISFAIPVAAGLGALLLVDRGTRRADLGASVLLVLALASGSIGVPLTIGAGVVILFNGNRWRRLLRTVALPTVLYGAWTLKYGSAIQIREKVTSVHPLDNLSDVPRFVADSVGANLAAILSVNHSLGWVLALGLAVAAAVRLVRDPRGSSWLVAALAMVIVYWGLTGLFRPGAIPPESRYLYAGTVFTLLLVLEVVRGVRLHGAALIAAGVLTAVIVGSNIGDLSRGEDQLRPYSAYLTPALGALELERARVDPGYRPEPIVAPDIQADGYLQAVDDFGSPAAPPAEITGRDEPVRQAADAVLVRAMRPSVERAELPRQGGPTLALTTGHGQPDGRGCLHVHPTGSGWADLRLPAAGVALRSRSDARLRLRRFAARFGSTATAPGAAHFRSAPGSAFGVSMQKTTVLHLGAGKSGAVWTPGDRVHLPWHLRVDTSAPFLACGLPPTYGAGRDRLWSAFRTGPATLEHRSGQDVLNLAGHKVPVMARGASGAVQAVSTFGRVLIVRGWAGDAARTRPADWVFVFSGGHLIANGPPALERPGLAVRRGEWARYSGFQLNLGSDDAASLASSRLRVFAVAGRRARELPEPRRAR